MRMRNFYERKLIKEVIGNLEESKNLLVESEYLIDQTKSVVHKFHQKDAIKTF